MIAAPAQAAMHPAAGLLRELAAIPADSAKSRQVFLRDHDTEFRIAFDSLLAVAPRWRTRAGLNLGHLAQDHFAATGDSVLLRDLRAVRGIAQRMHAMWLRGVRADNAGWSLYRANTFASSADSFQVAAGLYARVGDLRREAVVLGSLGLAYWGSHDWQASATAFEQARQRRVRLGDRVLIGRACRSLGLAQEKLGQPQLALTSFREALRIRFSDHDPTWDAKTLIYMSRVLVSTGQLEEAKLALSRAAETLGDKAGAADLIDLNFAWAGLHLSLGETDAAILAYQRIEQMTPAPTALQMTNVYQNLGDALRKQGDFANALDKLRQAQRIQQEQSDDYYLAFTLNALGGVFLDMSDVQAGRNSFRDAAEVARRSGNREVEVLATTNLALVAKREGNLDEAEQRCAQAFEIAAVAGDSTLMHNALKSSGNVAEAQRHFETALTFYRRAIRMATLTARTALVAEDMIDEGNVLGFLNHFPEARSTHHEAAALALRIRRPDVLWKAQLGTADAFEREGLLDSARVYNALAIETLDGLRRQDLADARRVSLLASQGDVYQAQIDVLRRLALQTGELRHVEGAFDVAERFKARGLLDVLASAGTPATAGADHGSTNELNDIDRHLTMARSRARGLAASGGAAESLSVVDARIAKLEAQRSDLLDRMRVENPRFATLDAGKPMTLSEVQRTLLRDKDAVLLSYSLVDSAAYLFTVTSNSVRLDRLAPRAEIDSCVQYYRGLLQDPQTGGTAFGTASMGLTARLLAPAQRAIERCRRVIIVPDGSLNALPFETLFAAGSVPTHGIAATSARATATRAANESRGVKVAGDAAGAKTAAAHEPFPRNPRYALQDREVSYGPSATVLAILARDRSRAPSAAARKALLAVGRPAFNATDIVTSSPADSTRGAGSSPSPVDTLQVAVRGELQSNGLLAPLPYSGDEVQRIAACFPKDQCTVLLDRDARESTIAAPSYLDSYRVLHFATHAIVDDQNPERSKLVLSFPRDASEDGFLHAYEIYGLAAHADLVVLSACETGLGRLAAGEGVLGLPRAFFFAGASKVIVSLWSVADESTSRFMEEFYRAWTHGQTTTAAALVRARRALQRDPRYAHPYYWAPFVLQGTDSPQ